MMLGHVTEKHCGFLMVSETIGDSGRLIRRRCLIDQSFHRLAGRTTFNGD